MQAQSRPAGVAYGECWCGCGGKTTVALRSDATYGAVKGEPRRFLKGHHSRKPQTYEVCDRGYLTPCWIWQGARFGNGYGAITRDGQQMPAHRWVYAQHRGSIDEALHLDHLCRVPLCVNPDHLEPVTCAENIRRGRQTPLTRRQVDEIRALVAGGVLQREVARQYGISQSGVSLIYRRHTWAT